MRGHDLRRRRVNLGGSADELAQTAEVEPGAVELVPRNPSFQNAAGPPLKREWSRSARPRIRWVDELHRRFSGWAVRESARGPLGRRQPIRAPGPWAVARGP